MNSWEEAGALCDVAIEGVRQCKGLSGTSLNRAWRVPAAAIAALEALIAQGLDDKSRARAADFEFAAVEQASPVGPGRHEWRMSRKAWTRAAQLLTAPQSISLGLGRFSALAKGLVHRGYFPFETLRLDVGGKLLKILREAPSFWRLWGYPTPTSEAIGAQLLRMHGDWCQHIGVVADNDWEMGVHAYGFGTWLDEFTSGDSAQPSMVWRDKLLRSCADGLERFGRCPMKPEGHVPNQPPWMVLENHVGHSARNGIGRQQWQWNIQFPLAGASAWDRKALATDGWADPALLDDPLRGRGAALLAMVQHRHGPGRELSELVHGQARWTALLEARLLRSGMPQPDARAAPPRRPRSL